MATERRVNGLRIVETERVESPLSGNIRKRPDKKVYFTQMMKALLEDDSEVYICIAEGCAHVETTSKSMQAHVRSKHSKSGKTGGGVKKLKPVTRKEQPEPEETRPSERKRDVPHKDLMTYIMGLPMSEVIELAMQGQQAEDFIAHIKRELATVTAERDEYKAKLEDISKAFKTLGVKL